MSLENSPIGPSLQLKLTRNLVRPSCLLLKQDTQKKSETQSDKINMVAEIEKNGISALDGGVDSNTPKENRIFSDNGFMIRTIDPKKYEDISPKVMTLVHRADKMVQGGTLPINLPPEIQAAYFGMLISIDPSRIGWIDLLDKYPKISKLYPNLRSRVVNESYLGDLYICIPTKVKKNIKKTH